MVCMHVELDIEDIIDWFSAVKLGPIYSIYTNLTRYLRAVEAPPCPSPNTIDSRDSNKQVTSRL